MFFQVLDITFMFLQNIFQFCVRNKMQLPVKSIIFVKQTSPLTTDLKLFEQGHFVFLQNSLAGEEHVNHMTTTAITAQASNFWWSETHQTRGYYLCTLKLKQFLQYQRSMNVHVF